MPAWFGCVAREQSIFFNYANKFMISFSLWFCLKYYFFYWLQLSLLIYARRHQIPLLRSSVVFILTMDELQCWLNSSLVSTAGREQASCLSQGENCCCSHNSHNMSPFLACSSDGHMWRGGEWFRLRHLSLSLVYFMSLHVLLWRNEKSLGVSHFQLYIWCYQRWIVCCWLTTFPEFLVSSFFNLTFILQEWSHWDLKCTVQAK